jgi:hypothetical protein
MSTSKDWSRPSRTTPPQSYVSLPLTPPPTDELQTLRLSKERQSLHAARIIQLFQDIRPGSGFELGAWTRVRLDLDEFDDFLGELEEDGSLRSNVEGKIRYAPKEHNVRCVISLMQI